MKSIANQYRDLKEGKMSQFNFMRNLRMTMPQYITNVTSFKDAVRILKNKSILNEADVAEMRYQSSGGVDYPGREKQSNYDVDSFIRELDRELEYYEREYPGLVAFVDKLGNDDETNPKYLDITDRYFDDPAGAAAEFITLFNKQNINELGPDAERMAGNPEEEAEYRATAIKRKSNEDEEDELDAIIKKIEDELDGPDKYKNQDYEGGLGENARKIDRDTYGNVDINWEWNNADYDVDSDDEGNEVFGGIVYGYDKAGNYYKGNFGSSVEDFSEKDIWDIEKIEDAEDVLGEDLKIVKEPNPNAGKYRIMSVDGKQVIAKDFFDSMEAAQKYGRENIRTSHKIVKLPAERGVYRKIDEGRKKKEPKKELHPNQIHPQELRMGIKVELEHTADLDKARKIALDHLAENPFYYTALKLAGIESPSAPKVKAPVEKKAKKKKETAELVDKDNQMQKVKMPKIVKEVKYNTLKEPSPFMKEVEDFIDNTLGLNVMSKELELQDTQDPNRVLLRYQYWEKLPKEALDIFKNSDKFKVEEDIDTEEEKANSYLYFIEPKSSLSESHSRLMAKLEALVRETINEYYDGRDNLDAENEY